VWGISVRMFRSPSVQSSRLTDGGSPGAAEHHPSREGGKPRCTQALCAAPSCSMAPPDGGSQPASRGRYQVQGLLGEWKEAPCSHVVHARAMRDPMHAHAPCWHVLGMARVSTEHTQPHPMHALCPDARGGTQHTHTHTNTQTHKHTNTHTHTHARTHAHTRRGRVRPGAQGARQADRRDRRDQGHLAAGARDRRRKHNTTGA
jgi:hypothetical protein